MKDEFIEVNREPLAQCANDHLAEFADCGEAKDSSASHPSRNRYQSQRCPQYRQPRSYQRDPKRPAYGRESASPLGRYKLYPKNEVSGE